MIDAVEAKQGQSDVTCCFVYVCWRCKVGDDGQKQKFADAIAAMSGSVCRAARSDVVLWIKGVTKSTKRLIAGTERAEQG